MESKEVTIDGITYTVRSTTPEGLAKAIKMLKASLKRTKKNKKDDDSE